MSLEREKVVALEDAILKRSLAEMRALLDGGLLTEDANKLLVIAVRTSFVSGVKFLLEMGADVKGDNEFALNLAVSNNEIEILQIRVEDAANKKKLNCSDWTLLYTIVISDFESGVELLLDNGVNVNARDLFGNTPLHCALLGFKKLIYPGFINTVISGAQIRFMNKSHEVAFVRNNCLHACEVLIKRGAFLNIQNNSGYTPLHVAVMKGCDSIVELLLKSGAKVNETDFLGWTPLHHVSVVGNRHYFRMLLEKGASLDIVTLCGRTPMDLNRNVSLWFEELQKLRAKKIKSLTLYDVFQIPTHKYPIIGNSKKIKAVVLSSRFDTICPFYGPSIKNIVISAISRCALLDTAQRHLTPLLPVEMKLRILSYLSDEDLKKVTGAFLAP